MKQKTQTEDHKQWEIDWAQRCIKIKKLINRQRVNKYDRSIKKRQKTNSRKRRQDEQVPVIVVNILINIKIFESFPV